MGECCPLLYCQEITYPCWWFIQNKMVTLKNLILKYISMKNILKRKCHVGINVVFIEAIETVWCMIHEKHVNYPMIMFAPSLIWDRHNLLEGGSPIILRGRREEGMYYFFSSTFNFFFIIWLELSLFVPFILPAPLFRRESRRKRFFLIWILFQVYFDFAYSK
jgi:hypothetical protein